MRPIISPYKFGSKSARALSEELRSRGHRSKRVRHDGNYSPYRNHCIINWGSGVIPNWANGNYNCVLNHWNSVSQASNKLNAFLALQEAGVQIPEFTTDRTEAERWLVESFDVLSRHTLQGHSGEGIVLHKAQPDPVVEAYGLERAPLYVKYIPKVHEYRIHIFRDQVVDVQQKRRRREVPDDQVNWQIRNHDNGFIFSRNDIDPPEEQIIEQSIQAVRALGLDFGAVDVIWNSKHQRTYVLEVNTAPGLEGTTVINYANQLERVL